MIRIQVVSGAPGPISASIRFTTRSWAAHAEFVDTVAKTTLGARSKGGVQLRASGIDRYSRIEQFTASGIERAYKWAVTQLGKPYDYSAIFGMALNRDWHDETKWFCSELLSVAFEEAGTPILSTRPSAATYRITPRDLLLSRLIDYLPTEG